MNNAVTRNVQITLNTTEQNKSLYGEGDQRLNLHELESTKFDTSFIAAVKKQAEKIACLVHKDILIKKEGGWQFHPMTPTLSQTIERQFQGEDAPFGEQEAFKDELAPGFGTAFLVGKRLVLTAAHCICVKDSNILDQKLIKHARLIFGFHEIKEKSSDYFFAKNKVCRIKKVVAHQFIRIRDKNQSYTEWTDWALLELDKKFPLTPLRMNMTEKVADKIELYMLGHPSGLPLKFTGGGFVQGNSHKDFFECNLDAFGGNSGSFVAAALTKRGSGMLCSGGTDYEITDNYKKTGQKRIQACRITKSQIVQRRIGDRLENCQRIDTLRFLLSPELLGLEGIKQSNSPTLVVKALQDNYRSRNTIPRLLHSALPIEEVYTELVLLEQIKEEKKEEKVAFEEQRINSWEDVRGSKTPIELKNIFNTDGKVQNKLLILGRAGIGKSILCQYIAYQWSLRNMWPGKFDALFWVPLRKLQHAHSAETTASFLFRVCCQEHGPTLYPKDVADYLVQNREKILFVLDGLDEVALVEGSLQKGIVDELLAFPHWVLTSRPHAAASIQADATIENVGFASKTIDAYIQKSFPDNSQAMIQIVRQNPIILGLCHIPINIELVCSILQKSKGNISFIRSMSGLYEELTLILQRRFLEKQGKSSAWHWGSEDIENDSEVSLVFKSLEAVAWEGMREKALFFSFNQGAMKKIYYNSYPSSEAEKREPFFKNMCASGFLQSTGDNPLFLHNEYSFLHLTFQEFFAARYLARLLHDNPKEAAKCIQEVKFNPRYKVVMWFTAGLLRNEGGDFRVLNAFFEMLDAPKDLVGLYGTLLKIRCLEECGWQKELQKIKLYEEEIGYWLEKMGMTTTFWERDPIQQHLIETFEISPQGAKRLFIPKLISCTTRKDTIIGLGRVCRADPQVVIRALLEALKDTGKWVRVYATEVLGQIYHADPQVVIYALLEALKDETYQVRETAAKALGQVGQANHVIVIPALLEALKDFTPTAGAIWVRVSAAKALGQMGPADSKTVILSLFKTTLKDEREDVRSAAAIALSQVSQTNPQTVILLLLKVLKNEKWEIRSCAAKALGQIGHVDPQTVIPHLLEALKDKKDQIRYAAVIALGQIGQAVPQAVIPHLLEALKNEKWEIRSCAAEALGEIDGIDPQVIMPHLLAIVLKCPQSLYRSRIIKRVVAVLGKIGQAHPQAVIRALLEALTMTIQTKERDLTEAIARELWKIGHADPQTVIPHLLEALKEQDRSYPSVRATASLIFALSKVGRADPLAVIPHLLKALKDEDHFVRNLATAALGLVGHADPKAIISALLEALKDKDRLVRYAAVKALGQVGHEDPKAVISALLALEDPDINPIEVLKKYDLSLYLKSYPGRRLPLTSTPLSSLIACYKEDPSQPSIYSAAITKKCMEENLPIFRIENALCCFEQGKLRTFDFPNPGPLTIQIEKRVHKYPDYETY
jgi:NLR family CARD domain-containing protein 3